MGEEDRWPSFEVATFSPLNISVPAEASEALYETGVPKDFFSGRYSVVEALSEVDVPGRGRCVQFGNTSCTGILCVDPANGEVIEVPSAGAVALVVNSSLPTFVRIVRALVERFPYYGRDVEDDDLDAVSEELGDLIRSIDQVAMIPDRFWSTFVDDVAIGDFATEDVLAN